MVMKGIGKAITKYPWIILSLILLITAGAFLQNAVYPMEESFDNKDFLPDLEVARAWTEYEDVFSGSYPFLILARGENEDILTVCGLKELVSICDNISSSEVFGEWEDKGAMGSNPDSPVQSLYGMREAVAQVENMIGDGQYYRSLTVGLGITYGIHITHRFIEDVNTSDDLIEASKKTILNTGYALFGAAATTIAGFGLLSFSLLPPCSSSDR